MLDIKFIRENKDLIAQAVVKKHINFNVDELIAVDDRRRSLLASVEKRRAEQNAGNAGIASATTPEERSRLIAAMKSVKNGLESDESALKETLKIWQELMLSVPNIPDMSVPEGASEDDNVVLKAWGDKTKFDFEPKDHVEIMTKLGILDLERGTRVHGFRGYYLKGEAVRLCFAIWNYALDFFSKKNFIPVMPPSIVRKINLYGTAHLPGDMEDFYVTQDGDVLSGTAEVPLMGYHSDEVLSEMELPKRYLGFSPCYRREAGAHGKDVHGLIRVHEFFKFEQLVLLIREPLIFLM